MTSVTSIPRFLFPRGALLLRPQTRLFLSPIANNLRYASNPSKGLSEEFRRRAAAQQSKTPVIPQPDKYRPPSHGKRITRAQTGQRYGPALTEEDKKRMRTKKYPNMMSPEGTFSHWFLNNKSIHLYISMGILVSLAALAWYLDFTHNTIYYELLPTRKDYLSHPIQSTHRFIEVYQMHMAHVSALLSEKRLKKYEDTEKRREYRKERMREAEERGEEYVEDNRYYIGEDGVRRRRVKKWFGIWE